NKSKPSFGPLDLHVLGTPPAFVLSQDQTLQRKLIGFCFGPCGPPLFVALRFVQFSRNDFCFCRSLEATFT
ncbi:hypothetical protein L3V64_003015, partial [Geobacillus stearothermophilus]|uniref:hypothetical protein n=1 Tax=Geobacillus stearothermophilus TaxID=1422 RepID=UPI001F1D2177